MTQLKTLKDLIREENNGPESFSGMDIVEIDRLKQEAIKWVKSIKSDEFVDKECAGCNGTIHEFKTKIISTGDTPIIFDEGEEDLVLKWIQYFFNISNEDLK